MSIARAALANYTRLGVTALSQLLLVPTLVSHLGAESYGVYSLVVSWVSLFAVFEVGAGVGALRAVATGQAQAETARQNAVLSTLVVLTSGIALIALLILALALPFLPAMLQVPEARRGDVLTLLVLLALRSGVLPWPLGVFRGALIGRGDIGLANAIQSVSVVLYAGSAIALLPHGLGLVGIGVLSLVAFGLEHAAYVAFCVRRLPGLRLSPRLCTREALWESVSLGGAQTLVTLSGLLLLKTDPLIVGWWMPLEAVAAYSVALRVAEQAFVLVKQLVNALPPFIARLDGSGDRDGLERLLVLGVRVSLVPAALVALPLAAFSGDLLALWVGDGFRSAGPALAVLATAMALTAPQMVISSLFTYTGRHRFTGRVAVLSAAVNLVASVLLVGPLGLLGVSLGTLVAVLAVDLAYAAPLAARAFSVTTSTLWRRGFAPALLPAAPAALAATALRVLWPATSLVDLVTTSLLVDLVYLAGFSVVGLEPAWRARLLAYLRSERVVDRLAGRARFGSAASDPL